MIDRKDHYRWHDLTGGLLSWKETLEIMCKTYGSFSGHWHSNKFWRVTLEQVPIMTEDECRDKVIEIEREVAASIAEWKSYQ